MLSDLVYSNCCCLLGYLDWPSRRGHHLITSSDQLADSLFVCFPVGTVLTSTIVPPRLVRPRHVHFVTLLLRLPDFPWSLVSNTRWLYSYSFFSSLLTYMLKLVGYSDIIYLAIYYADFLFSFFFLFFFFPVKTSSDDYEMRWWWWYTVIFTLL